MSSDIENTSNEREKNRLKRWADLIDKLKQDSRVTSLYHKPGMRKLIVIIEQEAMSKFNIEISPDDTWEILIFPKSSYINVDSIINDGYRKIGMQRVILEAITCQFIINYPGDLSSYGISTKRQTRVYTQFDALREVITDRRWSEMTEGRTTQLEPGFCGQLNALVEFKLSGDELNKILNITIAEK